MKKLLLILALAVITCAAYAQSVATIDSSVIMKSEFVEKTSAELETTGQQYQTELQIRQENLFLTENEINDLLNLVNSKGDQNKIKALQDANIQRSNEYQTLNQTKTLTDEQKTRQTELANYTKKSKENLENKANLFNENMNNLITKKREEIDNAIISACEKVAKDKKYSIVIEKNAVFYGGIDITKDVIAALPKVENK